MTKRFMTDRGPVDVARVHGYHFGDRLLEDVFFDCRIQDDKVTVVGVEASARSYFERLNTEMWLKAAQEYAGKNDVFDSDLGDAWVEVRQPDGSWKAEMDLPTEEP